MFYIYIILGLLLIHCTVYYLNIDIFQLVTRTKSDNINGNLQGNSNVQSIVQSNLQDNTILNDDLSNSIETSINELKNLNQYIDNELGQTTFC